MEGKKFYIKTPLSGERNTLNDAVNFLYGCDVEVFERLSKLDRVDLKSDTDKIIYDFLSSVEGEKCLALSEQTLNLTFSVVGDKSITTLIVEEGQSNEQAKIFAEAVHQTLGFEYGQEFPFPTIDQASKCTTRKK